MAINLGKYTKPGAANFVRADDIGDVGDERLVEIVEVGEDPDAAFGACVFLRFKAWPNKRMDLNKTNLKSVIDALGDDVESWVGGEIILCVEMVRDPKGKEGPGLRIRSMPRKKPASSGAKPAAGKAVEMLGAKNEEAMTKKIKEVADSKNDSSISIASLRKFLQGAFYDKAEVFAGPPATWPGDSIEPIRAWIKRRVDGVDDPVLDQDGNEVEVPF